MESGRLIRAYKLPEPKSIVGRLVNSVAFSPDGRRILSGGWWWDKRGAFYYHPELLLWRVPDAEGLRLLMEAER